MIKHLFIILLTTIFKRIRWIEKIKNNNINSLFLKYNIRINIQNVKIKGLTHYEIKNITIEKSSIEIEIRRLELFLDLWKLIKKRAIKSSIKIQIDKLKITHHNSSTKVTVDKKDFVYSNTKKITEQWESVYYSRYEKFINIFFLFFPERLIIQELKILFPQQDICISSTILNSSNDLLKANLETSFKNNINKYIVECTINKNDRSVTFAVNKNDVEISKHLYPFSFKKLYFSFKHTQKADEQKSKIINLIIKITNLYIQHRAIAATPHLINNFEIEVNINFTSTSFVVTKESGGNIDQMPFAFQFMHNAEEKDLLKFIFHIELDANLFLNSFFTFHVKAIKDIKAEGKILTRFQLMFNVNNPIRRFFDIKILENNLIIKDFDKLNLSYLNKPFVHSIYKNNTFLKKIVVGDLSNDFIKIEDLPTKIIDIITFSEDPNFYQHHGIDVFFIGFAIVSNIVARKFKRGGSTITMQVVRNLFLNHEKNFHRKIEEIILSLLIENYFNIPKKRLLEIYFNIIEFGPNIYGIKEASTFYFRKSPLELTMIEYIIIMYIIPRPIHFYEALISQSAQLFTNLKKYVEWLSPKLLNQEIITNEEFKQITNDIETISQSKSIRLCKE